jgi:hypothetical protein
VDALKFTVVDGIYVLFPCRGGLLLVEAVGIILIIFFFFFIIDWDVVKVFMADD